MATRDLNDGARRALALAARHVNASISRPVSEREILDWIRAGAAPADRQEELRAFVDETDTATLQDLVLSGAVSYADLATIADHLLPENHESRRWLHERRSF
jgi:hypothetical protein